MAFKPCLGCQELFDADGTSARCAPCDYRHKYGATVEHPELWWLWLQRGIGNRTTIALAEGGLTTLQAVIDAPADRLAAIGITGKRRESLIKSCRRGVANPERVAESTSRLTERMQPIPLADVANDDVFLGRVSDLLRRTGVEDAERLIQKLEALDRRARGIKVAQHICETPSEALAMHNAERAIENEPTVTGAPADQEAA